MQALSTRLTQWGKQYEKKVLIGTGIVLVGVVGFFAGRTYQTQQAVPITVQVQSPGPANPQALQDLQTTGLGVLPAAQASNPTPTAHAPVGDCPIVVSKNSTKYHQGNCANAKKIKPENRICFPTMEEAIAKGYQPAGCCHKK